MLLFTSCSHSNWEATIGFPVMYEQGLNTAIMQDEEKARCTLESAEIDSRSSYLIHKASQRQPPG